MELRLEMVALHRCNSSFYTGSMQARARTCGHECVPMGADGYPWAWIGISVREHMGGGRGRPAMVWVFQPALTTRSRA
jgi:hypothetical protein